MAQQYEVEIKSLLGDKGSADSLVGKLKEQYPNLQQGEHEEQLNHYFLADGDFGKLKELLVPYLSDEQKEKLDEILEKGSKFSLRTRQANETVLFVIKASVDDTTSENGIARMEFEAKLDITLEEADTILLDAGFQYQAKWSRVRDNYSTENMNVCIDKNAGYGYLAEFEQVTDDETKVDEIRDNLRSVMDTLGAVELMQDRLERMFAHYNANWGDYYGTDNIFTIE